MLDEYIEEQKIVYKILKNAVSKNRYSHAYLFETNGYEKQEQLIVAFAKYLLCPNNYSNNDNCALCTQCQKIDKNIFSEIKIIKPEGLWIKKEQLDDLQKEFSETSIESNKRIYIIFNAEKMNKVAANSILKFLEEPNINILAILVTDNINEILSTIISRCQNISLKKNIDDNINLLSKLKRNIHIDSCIEDEKVNLIANKVVNFVNYYEKNKKDVLLDIKKIWHNDINEREIILLALNIIILYYKDALNIKINRHCEIFDKIGESILQNTTRQIIAKINIINKRKESIKINMNNNLLMDKLIFEMEGVE